MDAERPPRWSREELERAREIARGHLRAQQSTGAWSSEAAVPPPAAPAASPVPFGPLFRRAAIRSRFRLEDMAKEGADPVEVAALREASTVLRDRFGPGWRVLRPGVRDAVLRQIGAAHLAQMLEEEPSSDDPLRKALLAALSGLRGQDLVRMDSGEVACLVQLHESVSTMVALPPLAELERKLELVRLLDPLRRITSTFSGRAAELKKLRDYVGVVPPDTVIEKIARAVVSTFTPSRKAPFLLCGQGGTGKTTLMARFILEHALVGSDMQFPFAYLDFDRPSVMAEKAGTVFLEAIRQIGLQYDSAYAASERLVERGEQALRAAASTDESLDEFIIKNFADFLTTLEVKDGPVLFVLDTFEEVQRRSSVYAAGVIRILQRLAESVPRLRVVVAGRNGIPDVEFDRIETLEHFDEAAAVAYLSAHGIAAATASDVYANVGGSPLALTLAIDLFRRGHSFELDNTQLNDEVIQAQLFDRILLHIEDEDVRRLAHPGLVLRRITAQLIREVLAQPCGIELADPGKADQLLAKLASESTLVEQVQPGVLVHRPDVRRLMLGQLRSSMPRKVDEIHRRAIEYYMPLTDPMSRAEEVYHRLSLHQSRDEVSPLVSPELEPLLANAMDELAPPEQALLADLLHIELPLAARQQADQLGWERTTSRMLKESMRSSADLGKARAMLSERAQRSAATDLRIVEVQLLDALGAKHDVLEGLVHDGIEAYRDAGNRDLLGQMLLAAASVDARRDRLGRAQSYLADAENLALRADDPLMLARVLDERARLLRMEGEELSAEAQADLMEAVARVGDAEWARELPLLRAIADDIGRSAPAVLGRALRLGALELTTSGLAYMRDVLRDEGLPADDVRATLLDVIYRRTPSPKLLDALISVTRGEAARREQRAHGRGQPGTLPAIRLKPAQRDKLADLLARHYGGARLALLSESRFQIALESVTFSLDIPTRAMDFIRATERDGRVGELLVKLARDRFDHAEVLAFLDSVGLGLKLRATASLPEKELRMLADECRSTLGALQARTCAIEAGAVQRGCGLLVGPDEVLTVLDAAIDDKAVFRFDEVALNGTLLDPGWPSRRSIKPPSVRSRKVRAHLDQPLGDLPVDPGTTDRTVQPRGHARTAVWMPAAGSLLLWLWREAGETFLSGVKLKALNRTPEGLLIVDAPMPAMAAGCACLDAGMNVIGLHCAALEGDAKRSAVFLLANAPEVDAGPAGPDPLDVTYADGRAFVDRFELRQILRSMHHGDKRILVVTGASRTGKSYTAAFIRHLADKAQFPAAELNLFAYAADRELTPVDLAVALSDALDLKDLPVPSNEQPARRWRSWLDAFEARIVRETWIILDGFEGAVLPPQVQAFIDELLERGAQGPHLRFVLIGYQGLLPIAVQALAATETPGPIEASELLRFFEQFLSEHGLSIEAKRIRQLADTVAGKMEGAGTARLRVMGREVPEACRELLSRQQG
jgi:hypothetical protein